MRRKTIEKINNLVETCENLQVELLEYKQKESSLRKDLEIVKANLSDKEKDLKEAINTRDELSKFYEQLEKDRDSISLQNENLLKDIAKYQDKIMELTKENKSLKDTQKRLKEYLYKKEKHKGESILDLLKNIKKTS